MTFSLILTSENSPQDAEILEKSIKSQTIPRIGENIAYDGGKFRVIRLVHDFNNTEQAKIFVFVPPNFVTVKNTVTDEENDEFKDNLDFYNLYM